MIKSIKQQLLEAKLLGKDKAEIQRLQQLLDKDVEAHINTQEYYTLWDRMMNKPISFNLAIIHYTTLIGMLNDGFEVRVGREEFRSLNNIPEEFRKLIIDKYDEQN